MSVHHAIHPSPYDETCPDCAGYPDEPIDDGDAFLGFVALLALIAIVAVTALLAVSR